LSFNFKKNPTQSPKTYLFPQY